MKHSLLFVAISLGCCIVGCGGGGGSGSSEPKETLSVKVVDGYLANAKVCLSVDGSSCYNNGQYTSYTDEQGNVSFDKEVIDTLIGKNGSVHILSVTKKGTKDYITGSDEATETTKNYVMSKTLFAGYNGGESVYVTPFSTLVDQTKPSNSEQSQEALDKIAKNIDPSLSSSDLNRDYNGSGASQNDKKIVATGELITRSGLLADSTAKLKKQNDAKYQKEVSVIEGDLANKITVADELKDSENLRNSIEDAHNKLGQSFKKMTSGGSENWRCGITNTNNLYCWGAAIDWGTLGNHEYNNTNEYIYQEGHKGVADKVYTNYPVPVEVALSEAECTAIEEAYPCYEKLQGVKDVSQGNIAGCAVTFDGEVYCWGHNYDGEGGQGYIDSSIGQLATAHKVVNVKEKQETAPYLNNIKQIVHGQKYVCALDNSDEVYCWGMGGAYQLGSLDKLLPTNMVDIVDKNDISMTSTRSYSPTPIKVEFPDTVKKVNSLHLGYDYTCAIVEMKDPTNEGNVFCWGNDFRGHASGNYDNVAIYKQRAKDAGLKAYNGEILLQVEKQYGDAYPTPYGSTPVVQNAKFKNAVDMAMGSNNYLYISCIIDKNHEVFCLSYSPDETLNYYQIKNKDGSIFNKAEKIYASENTMFVISTDGKVYSFGSDYIGLRGMGTTMIEHDFSTPNCVANGEQADDGSGCLHDVKHLSVSRLSVCASVAIANNSTDFEVYCWGSNTFGQTGFENKNEVTWKEAITNNYFVLEENYEKAPVKMPIGKDKGFIFSNPKE